MIIKRIIGQYCNLPHHMCFFAMGSVPGATAAFLLKSNRLAQIKVQIIFLFWRSLNMIKIIILGQGEEKFDWGLDLLKSFQTPAAPLTDKTSVLPTVKLAPPDSLSLVHVPSSGWNTCNSCSFMIYGPSRAESVLSRGIFGPCQNAQLGYPIGNTFVAIFLMDSTDRHTTWRVACHLSYEEFTRLAETRLAQDSLNYLRLA